MVMLSKTALANTEQADPRAAIHPAKGGRMTQARVIPLRKSDTVNSARSGCSRLKSAREKEKLCEKSVWPKGLRRQNALS